MNSIENKPIKTFSDNPLWNLVLTVGLPVFILKEGGTYFPALSPLTILMIALAIPVMVGLWDYVKAKKKNYVSILGVVNTALTGGFAVWEVKGFWFAVKEGTLPLLLGIFVLCSLRFKRNFVSAFLLQPQIINMDLLQQRARELGRENQVRRITQIATFWFSISFFVSAFLNLLLGFMIFEPIDIHLPQLDRARILNDQIAQMTWLGYAVIAVPLMIGTFALLWWLMSSLSNTLEVKFEDLLQKS